MKIKNIIQIIVITVIALNSCNRDEVFDREQYKTTVSIISSGAYNISEQAFQYTDIEAAEAKEEWIKGFISVNTGGALETTKDIILEFVVDESLVTNYNNNIYYTDSYKYAQVLSRDRYQIEDYSVVIPAGQRQTNVEIFMRLEGLTNDTVYFIPLRIASSSSYELNQNKATVLYRPVFRNKFVTGEYATYSQIAQWAPGASTDATPTDANPVYYDANESKRVFPITSNKVRLYAGKIPWRDADAGTIAIFQKSITFTVANHQDEKGFYKVEYDSFDIPERGVRLRAPRGNVTITDDEGNTTTENVELTDDFYNNTYELWFDGFESYYHTFRLYYEYWDAVSESTPKWVRIKEELRFQHQITIPK